MKPHFEKVNLYTLFFGILMIYNYFHPGGISLLTLGVYSLVFPSGLIVVDLWRSIREKSLEVYYLDTFSLIIILISLLPVGLILLDDWVFWWIKTLLILPTLYFGMCLYSNLSRNC